MSYACLNSLAPDWWNNVAKLSLSPAHDCDANARQHHETDNDCKVSSAASLTAWRGGLSTGLRVWADAIGMLVWSPAVVKMVFARPPIEVSATPIGSA